MGVGEKSRGNSITGLTESEVKRSYELYGNNRITERKRKPFFMRYLENYNDPIIRVLLISLVLHAVFSLGHVDWFETGGILLAIFLSTAVSTISEYGSENAFAKMQKSAANQTCRVIRNGIITVIKTDEIVRGDILLLSGGEAVPADGVIQEGIVSVDQSALNGESEEVEKGVAKGVYSANLHQKNLLFRGSAVLSGECKMEVARGGNETVYGQIASELQQDTRESPLRYRLNKLAKQISYIGYASAGIVAFVYLFNTFVAANHFDKAMILAGITNIKLLIPALLHAFTLAITIVVVAVPEGLPMMITVVLSSNMRRMLKDHVLVKKMVGIETAGSMNILFCDKTGTLTTGKMRVHGFISGDGSTINSISASNNHHYMCHLLTMCAFYNTESTIANTVPCGGNHTDRAILSYFSTYQKEEATVLHHIPFDSRYRYEAVQIREKETYTLIKGAPELLLPMTVSYLGQNGRTVHFTDAVMAKLRRAWHEATEKGQRVLAVCRSETWKAKGCAYDDLTLVGLVCIKDNLRRDARQSVETLQKAGIQVVMITGDNPETAKAIAEESGIYYPASQQVVMTGTEMSQYTDEELSALLPRLRVVARALPSDKSRLVKLAQKAELVTGMTGDGINDAPSLKLADVGFSMGEGTDIAKEASDIVLLDGSIHSIVNTVLYGRTIFHSIRKFITFQLMMNLSAVGVSLLGQYIGIESPITIIQMLWVNMIMDTLGGLAFAGEPPIPSYLKEPPKQRNENLINRSMLHQTIVGGVYVLLLCGSFLGVSYFRELFLFETNPLLFLTAFFVLFIFCGLFTCFNVRTERLNLFANIAQNRGFVVIMLLIAIVQVIMVCVGGSVFRTTPLSFEMWARVVALAFSVIPIEFLRKSLYRLKKEQ